MKKLVASAIILAVTCATAVVAPTSSAFAEYRHWHRHGPPPPPPRRHRHDNGAAIAGGLAAGVIGGLIGGALANSAEPRYYVDEPPPPRCWYEDRRVRNAYDGGWHLESVRVCR
ncbi:hypothetical protein M0654_05715 [Rhizobium sp. NTR19]|jgi:hypothetical protein|uniref:Transmembrane protein n=1 Tax=Neorhizobium turbinariae TaxID=2937795 RepID=A0ABT0INP5_9HYPH|nr:hypothetical protein [Neorhizobium turbinariae]MCK8779479.1 hypothetical protein [Neorhizobium turbinariae]